MAQGGNNQGQGKAAALPNTIIEEYKKNLLTPPLPLVGEDPTPDQKPDSSTHDDDDEEESPTLDSDDAASISSDMDDEEGQITLDPDDVALIADEEEAAEEEASKKRKLEELEDEKKRKAEEEKKKQEELESKEKSGEKTEPRQQRNFSNDSILQGKAKGAAKLFLAAVFVIAGITTGMALIGFLAAVAMAYFTRDKSNPTNKFDSDAKSLKGLRKDREEQGDVIKALEKQGKEKAATAPSAPEGAVRSKPAESDADEQGSHLLNPNAQPCAQQSSQPQASKPTTPTGALQKTPDSQNAEGSRRHSSPSQPKALQAPASASGRQEDLTRAANTPEAQKAAELMRQATKLSQENLLLMSELETLQRDRKVAAQGGSGDGRQ